MQSQIAMIVIGLTACIVLFDGWKLRRAHLDIPNLGQFPTGGMAWKSQVGQELVRNVTMLGAIVVMIAAPWFSLNEAAHRCIGSSFSTFYSRFMVVG